MNTSELNVSVVGNNSLPEGPLIVWQDWGWLTKQIITPVIVLVGLIGNTLSFCLMKTPTFRHTSYSHFLCSLAVFDSLTLIARELVLIDDILKYCGLAGFRFFTDFSCKLYNFCEHICYLMSTWLIVLMAFERFFVIYFPIKKRLLCRPGVAVAMIFVLFFLSSCTQVFRLIFVVEDETECVAEEYFTITYVMLHTYFYQICLLFVLPVSIIIICNGLILFKMRKLRKAVLDDSYTTSQQYRFNSRFRRTTFTLLTISFSYVVCTLPMIIITLTYISVWKIYGAESFHFLFTLKPYGDAFEVLYILNYSINFFIYVYSGKRFREKFVHLVKCNYGAISSRTQASHARVLAVTRSKHEQLRASSMLQVLNPSCASTVSRGAKVSKLDVPSYRERRW